MKNKKTILMKATSIVVPIFQQARPLLIFFFFYSLIVLWKLPRVWFTKRVVSSLDFTLYAFPRHVTHSLARRARTQKRHRIYDSLRCSWPLDHWRVSCGYTFLARKSFYTYVHKYNTGYMHKKTCEFSLFNALYGT